MHLRRDVREDVRAAVRACDAARLADVVSSLPSADCQEAPGP